MKKYIEATEEACRYLSDADPVMGGLIARFEPIRHELQTEYFETVVSNIVGQQLSGKVADVIWARFKDMLGGVVAPENILSVAETDMRAVGLSFRKAAYIKNLALFSVDGKIAFDRFDGMPNEEIIGQLIAVKGIGEWTAEMFLIFSLGREDVFSKGDGGLARAIDELYGRGEALSKGERAKIAEKWSPYRSIASFYLWESLKK
jgi:DNA-3-methyladenine glycosylase II